MNVGRLIVTDMALCVCCFANSTLVEIMPVGFNNYAFRLLARSCEVWYHEMNSLRNQGMLPLLALNRCDETMCTLTLPSLVQCHYDNAPEQSSRKNTTTRPAQSSPHTCSTRATP